MREGKGVQDKVEREEGSEGAGRREECAEARHRGRIHLLCNFAED